MKIRLYMTVPKTEVLGPGKRFAIWVQGCEKRCKGCIAPDAWDINGGYEKEVAELAQEILNTPNIEGITISGGEPFLQQEALCDLIAIIRKHKDLSVIIYTGMQYEEIANTKLANLADIIIDGEYVEELNDNKSLRGSSNQKVICLTNRYRGVLQDYYGNQGRKVEFIFEGGGIKLLGIPSKSLDDMMNKKF